MARSSPRERRKKSAAIQKSGKPISARRRRDAGSRRSARLLRQEPYPAGRRYAYRRPAGYGSCRNRRADRRLPASRRLLAEIGFPDFWIAADFFRRSRGDDLAIHLSLIHIS